MSIVQMHLHQYLAEGRGENAAQFRLWVPGESVHCHQLTMPAAARRKWTETLPWMLEDHLIVDPSQLHFAMGRADAADHVTALSVPHEQMEQWCSLCDPNSGRVVSMLPDYLALPWEEGGISLLVEADRWIVRCGKAEGYAGDEAFVTSILAGQVAGRPEVSVSFIGPKTAMPSFIEGQGRQLAESLDWSFCDYPLEFNLVRGEFRPTASLGALKKWWPSAAAIVLFVGMSLGYGVANYHRMTAEIPLLQADFSSTYRALLGGAPPSSGLRTATENAIAFRENQYLATQSSPLAELIELDTFLSGCSSCQIQSVVAKEGQVQFVIAAGQTVLDRLSNFSDLDVEIEQMDGDAVRVTASPTGGPDG